MKQKKKTNKINIEKQSKRDFSVITKDFNAVWKVLSKKFRKQSFKDACFGNYCIGRYDELKKVELDMIKINKRYGKPLIIDTKALVTIAKKRKN